MNQSLRKYVRPLGGSDVLMSPIGLGTVKFGRNTKVKYPDNFKIPEEEDLRHLLDLAKSLGVNTLDTAPAYGRSEERLGRLLKEDRQDWVLVGKAGEAFENGRSIYDFSPEKIEKTLEGSLKTLNTSYLDVFLIHSNGQDLDILDSPDLIRKLENLKRQGLFKACGVSTKTVEGGVASLETLDCVMATYHPGYLAEKKVLDHAAKLGKGVILKKALASGHIDQLGGKDPVRHALETALEAPAVTSIIIGTIQPAHLRENISLACDLLSSQRSQEA